MTTRPEEEQTCIEQSFRNHQERERGFACAQRVLAAVTSRVRGALGAIELSMSSYADTHAGDLDWQCIERALAEIKQTLADYTDTGNGNVQPEYAVLCPLTLVNEGIADCHHLLRQAGIAVHTVHVDAGLNVRGDPALLRQLLVHSILLISHVADEGAIMSVRIDGIPSHVRIRLAINTPCFAGGDLLSAIESSGENAHQAVSDLAKAHAIAQMHRGAIDIAPEGMAAPAIDLILPRFGLRMEP